MSIPPARRLSLSADTSIRHEQLKGKHDLTFFVFYSCLRSAPPISQSKAAAGSIRAASATAASCAASGKAVRVADSHACHVERATPAAFAAWAWLRLQSLRMCRSRPLMVCRYSAAVRRQKSGLSVYSVIHLPLKNHLTIHHKHPRGRTIALFAMFLAYNRRLGNKSILPHPIDGMQYFALFTLCG